jgi:hypothetical protein
MTASTVEPTLTTQEVNDLLLWCSRADTNGNSPLVIVNAFDGAMTSGSPILTSQALKFANVDVGLNIQVDGAGPVDIPLETTVLSYQSATQVTLAASAGTTVVGAQIILARQNPLWNPSFALYWGAAEGWRWKAGKVTNRYKFMADGGSFSREQLFDQCMVMAKEYELRAANEPASIRSRGNLVVDRSGLGTIVPWWYELAGN